MGENCRRGGDQVGEVDVDIYFEAFNALIASAANRDSGEGSASRVNQPNSGSFSGSVTRASPETSNVL